MSVREKLRRVGSKDHDDSDHNDDLRFRDGQYVCVFVCVRSRDQEHHIKLNAWTHDLSVPPMSLWQVNNGGRRAKTTGPGWLEISFSKP